jgi:hypothetical protein
MFVTDITVEQHIGAPMRLVAAADIEHQRRVIDLDGDSPAVERAQPRDDSHGVHRWKRRTKPAW